MYCNNLTKGLNGKLRCKLSKQQIILDMCKNCSNFILVKNKTINKASKKRIFVNKETYKKVYERDKGKCRLCGITKDLQLHHIMRTW